MTGVADIARNIGNPAGTVGSSVVGPRPGNSHRMFSTQAHSPMTVDVRDFGAIGDGLTLNTNCLQHAIDEVARSGGGVVKLSEGAYVSGSLLLRSRVTLHIAHRAALLGSLNPGDYRAEDSFLDVARVMRGFALVAAVNAKEVAIVGEGVIDGRGIELQQRGSWPNARPFLVRWVRCNGVRVSGVTLQNASARTMHSFQCRDVIYKDLEVFSYGVENNIGFDIDSCEQVRVSRCVIESQDDAISVKTTSMRPCRDVEVSHCTIRSNHDALKIGTASVGDIEDVSIRHCSVIEAREAAIKVCSEDGANIRRVNVSDIQVQRSNIPILVRIGERMRRYRIDDPAVSVGSISGLNLSNLQVAEARGTGILVTGVSGQPVEDVTLSGIRLRLRGEAGSLAEAQAALLPNGSPAAPDLWVLGPPMAAYGAVLRHVASVQMSDVEFEVELPDDRPALSCEDAQDLVAHGLRCTGSASSESIISLRRSHNILLDHVVSLSSSEFLVRVHGEECENIRLVHTEVPEGVTAFSYQDGASEATAMAQRRALSTVA